MVESAATDMLVTSFTTLGEALATGSINAENWKTAMLDTLESLTADLSRLFLSLAFDAAALGPDHYYEALGWLVLAGVSGVTSGFLSKVDTGGDTTYDASEGDPYSNFGNEGSKAITAVASRAASSNVNFQIVDQTSKSVTIDRSVTTAADGTKMIRAVIRDVAKEEMANGSFDGTMRSRYGVATTGRRRS